MSAFNLSINFQYNFSIRSWRAWHLNCINIACDLDESYQIRD